MENHSESSSARRTSRSSSRLKNRSSKPQNALLVESTLLNQRSQTKFDFDGYLTSHIPEMYKIDVLDDLNSLKPGFKLHRNDELKGFDVDEVKHELRNQFSINLIDHKSKHSLLRGRRDTDKNDGKRGVARARGHPALKKDALKDEYFRPIYSRLAKDEKKFVDSEKAFVKREIDEYLELLPFLGVNLKAKDIMKELLNFKVEDLVMDEETLKNLFNILPLVTEIKDDCSLDEMLMKFRSTVREIVSTVLNYLKIRKLEELLRKESYIYSTTKEPTDQEKTTCKNVNSLKRKRFEVRSSTIGPVHKIKFGKSGIQLIIDPISGPFLTNLKRKS